MQPQWLLASSRTGVRDGKQLRTVSHSEELSCLATKQTLVNTAKEKLHLWDVHKVGAKNSLSAFLGISISYLG